MIPEPLFTPEKISEPLTFGRSGYSNINSSIPRIPSKLAPTGPFGYSGAVAAGKDEEGCFDIMAANLRLPGRFRKSKAIFPYLLLGKRKKTCYTGRNRKKLGFQIQNGGYGYPGEVYLAPGI